MPALKHIQGPRVTVGALSSRPPEERDGNSQPRASGAGRPRKDGSPPEPVPMDQRHLRNRRGTLPVAVLRGPPSDKEIAAFEERWGDCPDDRLHPREIWDQNNLPMVPFDMDLAKEICDRLAEGQTIVWMVRHWPEFPGTRNWRSWVTQPEVKEYRDTCLEARSEATILAGQDALVQASRNVEKVNPSSANAFVNAAKNIADLSIKAAAALAPKRFNMQHVQTEATVKHEIGLSGPLQELIEQTRRSSRVLSGPPTIEGEVVG